MFVSPIIRGPGATLVALGACVIPMQWITVEMGDRSTRRFGAVETFGILKSDEEYLPWHA